MSIDDVADLTPRDQYEASAGQTEFDYSFPIFEDGDLVIDVDGVTQALDTDYTVTGAGNDTGGTYVFTSPLSGGEIVTDFRDIPIERTSDFQQNGPMASSVLNDELDRLTLIDQQLEAKIGRAIRFPVTAVATDAQNELSPISSWLGKFLRISTGGLLEAADIASNVVALTRSVIGGLLNPQTAAESAAGSVPIDKGYPAPDVRRFNVLGVGPSHDDTAGFTAAAAAGVVFVPSSGYTWHLTSVVDGLFISDGPLKFSGTGYVRYQTLSATPVDDNDNGMRGMQFSALAPSVLVVGDSITEGAFSTTYKEGWSYGFARSIMNCQNSSGFDTDGGYGYHSIINLANALLVGGITTTGTPSATGLSGSRISLAAGQTITITGRQMSYVDVVYDGAVSSGSISFALNGAAAYATKAVSGAGLNTTFSTAINSGALCSETDSIVITAVGGTVVITALLCLKQSAASPMVYVAGQSGTTYSDYTAAAKITEMAFYLNALGKSSNEKMVIFALGTNSIYNSGKTQTPAQMVASLNSIITSLIAACTQIRFVIWVPPRSNETLLPVINSSYTYGDYVKALLDYATPPGNIANGTALIRLDKSILSTGRYYSDGLHPHSIGHRVLCEAVCDALALPYNPTVKQAALGVGYYPQANIIMNSTWGPSGGSAAVRANCTRIGPQVFLSGQVQPNGAVSTTVGTLPVSMRPPYTMSPIALTDAGAIKLTINTNGTIVVPAVPASFLVLDGISFTMVKPT